MNIELNDEMKTYVTETMGTAITGADAELLAFNFFRNVKGYTIAEAAQLTQEAAISNLGKNNDVTVLRELPHTFRLGTPLSGNMLHEYLDEINYFLNFVDIVEEIDKDTREDIAFMLRDIIEAADEMHRELYI